MTANELNEMVAEKVMGQHRVSDCPLGDSSCMGKYEPMVNGRPCLPDYANDIAAAWQVVEKLITLPYWDGLSLEHVTHDWRLDNGDGWICAQSDSYQRDQGSGEIVAVATTLPRAICLAALEAIGVEVE